MELAQRHFETRGSYVGDDTAPQTGMVSESVIETANALIARGVPATRALEMAQETASNWRCFSIYATGIGASSGRYSNKRASALRQSALQ